MRIGILTYGLDRSPTGIGRYTLTLIEELAGLPNAPDIVLLASEREDHSGLWKRFEHHTLSGCRLLPALLTVGNATLSAVARRQRLDLVHDPNGIAPFLGPKLRIPRIVTIHDAFAYVHPQMHNQLDNWRYRWQLPTAAARADAVLTNSEHSRQDLLRYLRLVPDKVHVTLLGVDRQFAPVKDSSLRDAVLAKYQVRLPYLLYVGGINARKNIARLLEAFARIRSRYPDLTLVLGGKRQWKTREIDQVLQLLDLGDTIHFPGYLDDADLPVLYSAAEAFIFPSLYEGFGLPPLEAMACGTPVVTSNTSSLPEVVGDAALMIDPYDIDALAHAIERVLTDDTLRSDLRRRGLARARQLPNALVAQRTFDLYQRILAQNE